MVFARLPVTASSHSQSGQCPGRLEARSEACSASSVKPKQDYLISLTRCHLLGPKPTSFLKCKLFPHFSSAPLASRPWPCFVSQCEDMGGCAYFCHAAMSYSGQVRTWGCQSNWKVGAEMPGRRKGREPWNLSENSPPGLYPPLRCGLLPFLKKIFVSFNMLWKFISISKNRGTISFWRASLVART